MMSLLSVSAPLKGAVIGQEVSDYQRGLQKNPAEELQLTSVASSVQRSAGNRLSPPDL